MDTPYAQVTVSDTGQGISPDFLPHVFERFRQADSSTTRTSGGLGLGLAVVRHLVDLHGGAVAAESAGKDQGATFTVKLPLVTTTESWDRSGAASIAEPRRQSAEAVSSVDLPSLTGLRVLVVDDEPDMRELLTVVLADHGAEVRTAGSTAEALAEFEQQPPDVLLADIGMPHEDGYTLIRTLRARSPERGGNVPAAALTAYAKVEDRMAALSAGFQTHIPKPVDLIQVVAIVASLGGRTVAIAARTRSS